MALLASLFKTVTNVVTNDDGESKLLRQMLTLFMFIVDHKKTLCAYFKAGVCEKGKKCKFSHDLSLEDNRGLAIDLYTDPRA